MCEFISSLSPDSVKIIIDILGFIGVLAGLLLTNRSLKNDKKAELADCIADYNFNFLASKELNDIERILESCNVQYEELIGKIKELLFDEIDQTKIGTIKNNKDQIADKIVKNINKKATADSVDKDKIATAIASAVDKIEAKSKIKIIGKAIAEVDRAKKEAIAEAIAEIVLKESKIFEKDCYSVFEISGIIRNDINNIDNYVRASAESGTIADKYQHVINYLVYLEGFAALINQGIVKIKDVNDLFGYRFFLAMNNPVIQKFELKEFKEYYTGCYKAYEKWKQYCIDNKKSIPLAAFDLTAKE